MHDTLSQIPSPCYVLEEELLRRNLALIRSVKEAAGVNIILAFKAYALWKSFPVIREYIPHSTASSIHEARLAFEEMGSPAHTYSPAYTERDFPTILKYSSHITFNSLTQFERFYPQVVADGNRVSCGLRINPEYSEVETDLYNPCAPGSRRQAARTSAGSGGASFPHPLRVHLLRPRKDFGTGRRPIRASTPPYQMAEYGRRSPHDPQGLRYRTFD